MHRLAFAIVLPAKGKTVCKRDRGIGPATISGHPKREELVVWARPIKSEWIEISIMRSNRSAKCRRD